MPVLHSPPSGPSLSHLGGPHGHYHRLMLSWLHHSHLDGRTSLSLLRQPQAQRHHVLQRNRHHQRHVQDGRPKNWLVQPVQPNDHLRHPQLLRLQDHLLHQLATADWVGRQYQYYLQRRPVCNRENGLVQEMMRETSYVPIWAQLTLI